MSNKSTKPVLLIPKFICKAPVHTDVIADCPQLLLKLSGQVANKFPFCNKLTKKSDGEPTNTN